jgi:hypothetical protein
MSLLYCSSRSWKRLGCYFLVLGLAECLVSSSSKESNAWPSYADFASLNKTLGGTLGFGVPLAEPCFGTYNGQTLAPNLVQCLALESEYTNETFIAEHFGGYQNVNWGTCQAKGSGCALESTFASYPWSKTCYQGSVPTYYVPVRRVEDVQAVLQFVRKTKVPLVIKNSGHDFKGRSSGPGSLGLWTYTYKPDITLTKDFVPEGCPGPVGRCFVLAERSVEHS